MQYEQETKGRAQTNLNSLCGTNEDLGLGSCLFPQMIGFVICSSNIKVCDQCRYRAAMQSFLPAGSLWVNLGIALPAKLK